MSIADPNAPPEVDAGEDLELMLESSADLDGSASDDGLPSGVLTIGWSKVSGPGKVTIADASAASTTARFSRAGEYVLRLTVTDGEWECFDDVVVTVVADTVAPPPKPPPPPPSPAPQPTPPPPEPPKPEVDRHRTGLVDPSSGKWYLYDETGTPTASFFYGNPGDYPFMGDWDGDGVETPGLYRQTDGYVYLRSSNTQGIADIRFFFGDPGDIPLAGDFNGDGFDTVSICRPSNQKFYIINKLGSNDIGLGAADVSFVFGDPGDKPFVGDFDGDGIETAGLHRESTGLVYFRNSHTAGNADSQFIFGDPGDRLVAGDWTGDGTFTPGLFRPSSTTMYFRHSNTQGIADDQWTAGQPTWLPVSGVLER